MTKIYEYVVKQPKITSPFGYRIDPITKKKKYHAGLDLVSRIKDRNLYAIDEGYVQKVVTGQNRSKLVMVIIYGYAILDIIYHYYMHTVKKYY